MSSKPKTQQLPYQQTNTYGYQTPPDTKDVETLRDWEPSMSPSTPFAFARAKNELHDSFNNVAGAHTTPAIRDAIIRSGEGELAMGQAQATREDMASVNGQKFGQLATVAELTNPKLVQTGSSGYNSQSVPGSGIGNALIGGAAQAGTMALM